MSFAYSETNSRKSTFSNSSKLGEMPSRFVQSGIGYYAEGNILKFSSRSLSWMDFENISKYNDTLDVLNLILTIIAAYDSNRNLADGEIESLFGCDIECNFELDEEDWLKTNPKENSNCDSSGIVIDSVFDLIESFTTPEIPEINEQTTTKMGAISGEIDYAYEQIDSTFIDQLLKTGIFRSEIDHLFNSCDMAKCTACKDPFVTEEKIAGITTLGCFC